MITISLCMIVRDEAAVLARCLDSVDGIADEIIIMDTGSADETEEIARRYTSRVYSFEWIDDFSAARNAAFARATMEYILWLDADDLLEPAEREKFLRLKADFPEEVDVAMLPYRVGFDPDGRCNFHYFRERLVRSGRGYRWREPVHEYIDFGRMPPVIREFDVAVTHGHKERPAGGSRNLDIYRQREAAGEEFSARALYYYARELREHGCFEEATDRYRRFIAREDGWGEDRITAAGDLSDCLRALGRKREALEALCMSFAVDTPRAEVCCNLGRIHLRDERFDQAAFWYELALTLPRPGGWGFVFEDAWGFIPHMQLCVIHDRLGDRDKALAHHRAARAIKPGDPAVLHNDAYFGVDSPRVKKELE